MNLDRIKKQILLCCLSCTVMSGYAQDNSDKVHYTGTTLSNVDYHHGQLSPAVGTHNIQTMRASRIHPEITDGLGYTYNHAPMLAYWNGKFYLQYLNAPVGEHMPPGEAMLQTSTDGYNWTKPELIFPKYKVPDGYSKGGQGTPAKDLYAITHFRVAFFTSSTGRLLAMTSYGVCLDMKDDPNDGNGIGRVIREIRKDGSFGPMHFIRYNHAFNEKNTDFPFYKKSKDKGFVQACDELLANPLYMMQWVEEADRNDPIIPLKKPYKAFSYYRLNDGRIVGLWKHALSLISNDGGKTWPESASRAPGFVNSNAKIWGQKTSDGKYATVYNPSEFRWPLAVSTSIDGLDYNTLYLVHGDMTPMRYGGNYKSRGPQYVRGIQDNNGTPPDGNMWVTYSVNKEDIWVAKVPVPVTDQAMSHADETFASMPDGKELDKWNIYSPLWAPVKIEKRADGKKWLALKDWDKHDYAKVERVIPEAKLLNASFSVIPQQNDKGSLQIEFQNAQGEACTRISFDADGIIRIKTGARYGTLSPYVAGETYDFDIALSTPTRSLTMKLNGKNISDKLFFNPVANIKRVVFRTGDLFAEPTPNTPADRFTDMEDADADEPMAAYYISGLHTKDMGNTASILKSDDYKSYVDHFNTMEDENVVQAIPNAQSWEWMKANIPLFDCPQKNFEEIYYYRWWSYRKHIKDTPGGYAITEFMVDRPYADKYNMIACAIGHHVYEGRWLHDQKYVNQNIHTWFRGNEGKPMNKLRFFSSWTADALYNKYMVDGDQSYLTDMYPDLQWEFSQWDDHLLPSGLYWQEDVKDGMEEQISGGRRKHYARPTINSYMYGNAKALAEIAKMKGDKDNAIKYTEKATQIKELVETQLWNNDSTFFETLRKPNEFALVREAIGFIPWYFDLPSDKGNFSAAWKQITDTKGFCAPFGLTTAERRHPLFRSHGCCRCEWDGAVWPFATSQTLTAMANVLNKYDQKDVLTDSIYFKQMETYVQSQYYRGQPYVGEYLDEKTGYWLKGDEERSRYYNHSTFNDLIISGLIGLRPRADKVLEVNPLVPKDKWDWFCLDNILYHNRIVTIVWDKTGERYKRGKGFYILVDGKEVERRNSIEKITYNLGS